MGRTEGRGRGRGQSGSLMCADQGSHMCMGQGTYMCTGEVRGQIEGKPPPRGRKDVSQHALPALVEAEDVPNPYNELRQDDGKALGDPPRGPLVRGGAVLHQGGGDEEEVELREGEQRHEVQPDAVERTQVVEGDLFCSCHQLHLRNPPAGHAGKEDRVGSAASSH